MYGPRLYVQLFELGPITITKVKVKTSLPQILCIDLSQVCLSKVNGSSDANYKVKISLNSKLYVII